MTEENDVIEPTEDGEATIGGDDMVSREQYDEALKQAEKYKWYFKKSKAKEKDKPATNTNVDYETMEKSIMDKMEFYSTKPDAKQYKEQINEYVGRWLSHDEAYVLAAGVENPSLLVDQQTINRQEAKRAELTWTASTDAGWADYASRTETDQKNASDEESDKYWDYKIGGGK